MISPGRDLNRSEQVAAQTSLKSKRMIPIEKMVPKIPVNESGDHEIISVTAPQSKALRWVWAREAVGLWMDTSEPDNGLLEQINTTHDLTDYMWYTTT
jgi:hypothetical protein